MSQLPVPSFYDPKKVGEVWKVDYQARAAEARLWARRHGLQPVAKDRVNIGLMLIDVQNTFCIPGYELFVGGRSGMGAVVDNVRLTEFIYRNMHLISGIDATMDTHRAMQIFHPLWFVDDKGENPPAYTQISVADVQSGKWKVNPAVVHTVSGASYVWMQTQLLDYVKQLEAAGKYSLMVWPSHAMLGGIGHALVPSVHEAMFFFTHARLAECGYEVKGGNPVTENYSVLRPEVMKTNNQVIAQKNAAFIQKLLKYDILVVAGQAKSHCLAWTVSDLLGEIAAQDPALAKKVYLLEDATSPVVTPAYDFTNDANKAFDDFKAAGMHVVTTAQPIETWPDVNL